MDETLVSSSTRLRDSSDHVVAINCGGVNYDVFWNEIQIFVNLRPYVLDFLAMASNNFEVVIFTAAEVNYHISQKEYADRVLELLDPTGKLINHRLYRDSCVRLENIFIKDLSVLGRDLKKTLIVDNVYHSFAYQVFVPNKQLENGVLIKSYINNGPDNALSDLMQLLLNIKDVDDIRVGLKYYLEE